MPTAILQRVVALAGAGRIRPRFSLRTLLLATLAIGAGATCWWNWQPWAPAYTIDNPQKNTFTIFSPDDRTLATHQTELVPSKTGGYRRVSDTIQLRDTDSGRIRREIREDGKGNFSFSPAGKFLLYGCEKGGLKFSRVWHTESGEPLAAASPQSNESAIEAISSCDSFALINRNYSFEALVSLPDFRTVIELKNDYVKTTCAFSHNERWLAFQSRGAIRILSTETGRELKRIKTDEPIARVDFSPDDECLLLVCNLHHVAEFFETRTWSKLAEYSDFDSSEEFSTDGKLLLIKSSLHRHSMPLATGAAARLSLFQTGEQQPLWSQDANWHDFDCARFSDDGTRILSTRWQWDTATGTQSPAPAIPWHNLSPDQKYVYTSGNSVDEILRVNTGAKLFSFERFERPLKATELRHSVEFAHKSGWFVSERQTLARNVYTAAEPFLMVWKMRRPADWWGAAWLPEFWLATLLITAMFWSMLRDRRIINARIIR